MMLEEESPFATTTRPYGVKVCCRGTRGKPCGSWLGTLTRGSDGFWVLVRAQRVRDDDDTACFDAQVLTCRRCRMSDGRHRTVRRTAKSLARLVHEYQPYGGLTISV
jgi:hypothetical protein